ncbi:choice-of-anchor R domain-containing protein [Phenylobacterium sp.]|uniref:choice-of-anchor R domain-containing protein n=1 Tax=Phenylobacterium sp. TaxID=1871053 RepID=UPI003983C736
MRTALAFAAALAAAPAAHAEVLLTNLGEPIRATTVVDIDNWAAQSFVVDANSWSLTSIRTVAGDQVDEPGVFAELRKGSTTGAVVTAFGLPSFLGAQSVRTFTPLSATTLSAGATYYFILGVTGGGSVGWSYAEGNDQTGPGTFGNYEYSFDQAATWTNFGGDNPYLMEINVAGVPEPAAWALMILGFGVAGVALRRSRARTASCSRHAQI